MKWLPAFGLSLFVVAAFPTPAAHQADNGTTTIRLVSKDTYSKVFTDRPPLQQASKGDVILVASKLRNDVAQFGRPKGAVVGEGTVVFTIRSWTAADVIVESKLPGGWLRAAGRTRLGPRQTFSVTGGTGRFARARGTGESMALAGHGDRRLLVYRVRLP